MPASRRTFDNKGCDDVMRNHRKRIVYMLMGALAGLAISLFMVPSPSANASLSHSKAKGKAASALPSAQEIEAYKRPASTPYPEHNAHSKERETLGAMLFFDPRLSASGIVSCATCHNPSLSFGDGLPKGVGHNMKVLGRRTPTILNMAWSGPMMWDGRAETLEDQALGPIESSAEMNMPLATVEKVVSSIEGYQKLFSKAYPGEKISSKTMAKAIATFERTIVSPKAPFDRWLDGDASAISASAKRGFRVFGGKGRCDQCHSGWRFTDDGFYDIGIKGSDKGRGDIIPGIASIEFAFKTPTLRDVDRRGPYMHDGSVATLEEVVDHYNRGGDTKREGHSEHVVPLRLTKSEKRDLVEFMKTLTSPPAPVVMPQLPR